jgi:hypothetical protein
MTSDHHPPEPLHFGESESVVICNVSDLYRLLKAVDETMPKDATLYIEGTSIAPEVKRFLELRGTSAGHEISRGTIYPGAETFHLPLEGQNLAELRSLAEHCAEPEIGDHLAVYRNDELLLTAYDAGDGEVNVARSLSDDAIGQLRRLLVNS